MTQFQVFATSILRTPRRTPTTLSQMRQGLLSRYRLVFCRTRTWPRSLWPRDFRSWRETATQKPKFFHWPDGKESTT